MTPLQVENDQRARMLNALERKATTRSNDSLRRLDSFRKLFCGADGKLLSSKKVSL